MVLLWALCFQVYVMFFALFLLSWAPVATSSSAYFYFDSYLAHRGVCST